MEHDFQYIRDRLDRVVDVLSEHGELLARNTASLEEHMRRSDALETRVEQVSDRSDEAISFVKSLKILGIIITCLGTAIGAILGLIQLLHL